MIDYDKFQKSLYHLERQFTNHKSNLPFRVDLLVGR